MPKTLTIPTIFTAVDKFSNVVSGMGQKLNSFAERTQKFSAQFQKVGRTALITGLAIAAPLGLFAKSAIDYESGLASLSAITGVTGNQFELFQQKVEDVSAKTKRGPIEIAKAFELAGSAMPELLQNADALSRVAEQSIVLSKASGDELEGSIRSLTGVMNQFSLGADQAQRTINVLAAGAKVGAASIMQTNEAMVNFGSTAAGANLSVEQATAAIQVMSKYGLFGAEAGTKLRGSLLRLQQAGIGYKNGQFNINDALGDAYTKMQKLTSAKKRDAYLNKLFGAENISTGRILLNNIALFKEYTQGVTGTNEATTQAGIRSQTTAEKIKAMRAQWQMLSIKIGTQVLPILISLFDKISPVITGVVEWVKQNPKLTKTLVIAAGAIAALSFAVYGLSVAMGVFNTIAAMNPIGWLVIAFLAQVAVIGLIIYKWKEWGDYVKAFYTFAFGPLGVFISMLVSIYQKWGMITDAFKNGGILAGIKAIGVAILDGLLWPLQKMLELVAKLTGANWAANWAASVEGFRANIGATAEAVNPKAAEQDGMAARNSETTNNAKVDINVNDPKGRTTTKASPGVNVKTSSTMNFGGA